MGNGFQDRALVGQAKPHVSLVNDALDVVMLPVLDDNYCYLIRDADTGLVAAVDPGEANTVIRAVELLNDGRLDMILLTHHHGDHIGGVEALRERFGARVVGAAADQHRLPPLDVALRPDEPWEFGAQIVDILDVPGHTLGHIAFHFPRAKALFCGDALFAMGCGRLFEGTPEQAWSGLLRLMALPGETRVYAGHEYTLSNGRFALQIEPGNAALTARMMEVERLRAEGLATLPTTIARELATNPFLRAREPAIKAALGMDGLADWQVFAELRERKNRG